MKILINVVMYDIILMFISCFFLLMTLVAVYFIFIFDYGNNVRQKANLSNLLIKVQNGS